MYTMNHGNNVHAWLSPQCGSVETHALGQHVPKCMSFHRTTVVITRHAHCFHDSWCTLGINPPSLKKTTHSFLPSPLLLNLQIVHAHLSQFPPCRLIFVNPSPPIFSMNPLNIKIYHP